MGRSLSVGLAVKRHIGYIGRMKEKRKKNKKRKERN
jgi:hypothetical protein